MKRPERGTTTGRHISIFNEGTERGRWGFEFKGYPQSEVRPDVARAEEVNPLPASHGSLELSF